MTVCVSRLGFECEIDDFLVLNEKEFVVFRVEVGEKTKKVSMTS